MCCCKANLRVYNVSTKNTDFYQSINLCRENFILMDVFKISEDNDIVKLMDCLTILKIGELNFKEELKNKHKDESRF